MVPPPALSPDNGLFQGRPAMLDGTGALLAGCRTSRENFSAVFSPRIVAAADTAVVTVFFWEEYNAFPSFAYTSPSRDHPPSNDGNRGGGLGGGKATDDRGIVYVSV